MVIIKKYKMPAAVVMGFTLLSLAACFQKIEGQVTAYNASAHLSRIAINRTAVPGMVHISFEDMGKRYEDTISVMPGERTVTVCFEFDEHHPDFDKRNIIDVMGLPTHSGQINRLQLRENIKYGQNYTVHFIVSAYNNSDGGRNVKFDDVRIVEDK